MEKVHVFMGMNKESIGPAEFLKDCHEVVYILDEEVKGVHQRKDFTFVDQKFVEALEPIFNVIVYEPPYKVGQLQRKKSFLLDRKIKD